MCGEGRERGCAVLQRMRGRGRHGKKKGGQESEKIGQGEGQVRGAGPVRTKEGAARGEGKQRMKQ